MRNLKRNVVLLGVVLALVGSVHVMADPVTKSVGRDVVTLEEDGVAEEGWANIVQPNGNNAVNVTCSLSFLDPDSQYSWALQIFVSPYIPGDEPVIGVGGLFISNTAGNVTLNDKVPAISLSPGTEYDCVVTIKVENSGGVLVPLLSGVLGTQIVID